MLLVLILLWTSQLTGCSSAVRMGNYHMAKMPDEIKPQINHITDTSRLGWDYFNKQFTLCKQLGCCDDDGYIEGHTGRDHAR